jgi:hypothetical protein
MSISVVFASRGRPDSLVAAVDSLNQTAKQPENVEIIIGVDPDDTSWLSVDVPSNVIVWTAPERYGYNCLHKYLNELAKIASGDWLMWFNDDMRMVSKSWDDVIQSHRPAVIWPFANHVHHANIAPAWPRAWSEATGHASPTSHMDTYWQRIGEAIGRHDRVTIELIHDRADVTGNHNDQTYAEGRKLLGSEGMVPGWNEDSFQQHVARDSAIIRELL